MNCTRHWFETRIAAIIRDLAAVACIASLAPGTIPAGAMVAGQDQDQPAAAASAKLPSEQLDSLVAPIALYPDPLLTQTLIASTYPLEIIQLQQWLDKNKNVKDQKKLTEAVQKQDWDPSIQAMAAFPEVVKRMGDSIKWTADLGNAFLAQQNDVMDAVQRMRAKAQANGQLKSSSQQKVETQTVESKPVIVIEQASPQVVYVPSYDPVVVYGAAPIYAYPPIYYPPPGYYAAGMAISFGVGVAMGAAWGGGWGWNTGWGGNNDININRNNTFNRTNNISGGNRASTLPAGGRNNWQHNPQHRGGAPYPNRDIANKYGGSARGDTLESRRQQGQQGQRGQNPGVSDRRANTGQGGDRGNRQPGTGDRGSMGDRSAGAGNANRGGQGGAGGGGDRVGSRDVPKSPGSTNRGAFGGSGMSGRDAGASASRGSSSMGGSRGGGGGGRRGGGGGGRRR